MVFISLLFSGVFCVDGFFNAETPKRGSIDFGILYRDLKLKIERHNHRKCAVLNPQFVINLYLWGLKKTECR
jgi:hypothetical protein